MHYLLSPRHLTVNGKLIHVLQMAQIGDVIDCQDGHDVVDELAPASGINLVQRCQRQSTPKLAHQQKRTHCLDKLAKTHVGHVSHDEAQQ